eukprot:1470305-Pyramimonas_sp.AAC.1
MWERTIRVNPSVRTQRYTAGPMTCCVALGNVAQTDAAPPPGGQLLGSDTPKVAPNWLEDKYWIEGPEEYAILRLMRKYDSPLVPQMLCKSCSAFCSGA